MKLLKLIYFFWSYKTLFGVESLEMNEIQRQIYDAIYSKCKFECPMRNSGAKELEEFYNSL